MPSFGPSINRRRLDGADFVPADFFILRTPLLPVEELLEWSRGLQAPQAADREAVTAVLDADRRRLRVWLRDLVERPEVIEALYLASPDLLSALAEWRRDPDGKKGRRAEEALVRYALRMTARATPFGLFAGCTTGRVGERNRLRLSPRQEYGRHSRLDVDYLFLLAEELNREAGLRRVLVYRPNSSLYRAAGRIRYAEVRLNGDALDYHLVAVEPDDFVEAALARAASGATIAEIAAAVAAADPEGDVALDDAETFVGEMIDSQMFVSELWPAMTGPEAIHGIIDRLESSGHRMGPVLRSAHETLDALDRQPLGNDPGSYRDLAAALAPLPARADARRLYQVDLVKPGETTLTPAVLDAIAEAVEVLHRLSRPDPVDWLEGFRDRFIERYGTNRLVPLVEALDDEAGVGLPAARVGIDASPLLEGIHFPPAADERVSWGKRDQLLLRKIAEAASAGSMEVEITAADLASLDAKSRAPLPNSFQVLATIAAPSEEALDAGDVRVLIRQVFGPSGARLAGRFCHCDPSLTPLVMDHLRAEEALDPDVIFAEIVHMPAGRVGNIASRPLLREWEIPFLGVSGAPRERQIAVDDLRVTVEEGEVALYSERLGKRVMPRLSSAHNFIYGALATYRFLCSLQHQGICAGLQWRWDPFQTMPFLPRIRCGRAVLSRAMWHIERSEIEKLTALRGAERFLAVRRWREERRMPRQVVHVEADHELFVDFDNVLAVDAFVSALTNFEEAFVSESWPGFDDLPVSGPEGRFFNEIVVPFDRKRQPRARVTASVAPQPVERILPPGSRWLYLKLYTGAATADHVLRDTVAPLVAHAMESGAADRWFFLRYSDPQWHLRVRFGGDPDRLRGLIGDFAERLEPELAAGRIWRWQLDTYEREVERYGGAAAIDLAERIFHADSDAALAALADLSGDAGADARWRLTLAGIDHLLADFGLDLAERADAFEKMRRSFAAEFNADADFNRQLARRLREVGDDLYSLLERGVDEDHPFRRRSEALAPLVAELRSLEARGLLTFPVNDLVWNYSHMFVNRMIRSDQRAHELVLYDLLHKLTQSRLRRAGSDRAESRSPAPDPTPALAE